MIELYGRRVFALVFARLLDPDVAEDVSQEILMATLAALREGKLHEPEKLTAFVRGTARNLCNNHLRSRRRRVIRLEVDLPSGEPDPETSFRHREILSLVGRSLAELDNVDQKILLWSLVDKLRSEEIAQRLGMRADTVRQHKHRALQKVRSRTRSLSQNPRADHKSRGGPK